MASAAVALSNHVPGPGLCSCPVNQQSLSEGARTSDTHLELLGGGIPCIHELAIIPRRRARSEIERDGLANDDVRLGLGLGGGREGDACAFRVCLEVVGSEVGHGRSEGGRRGGGREKGKMLDLGFKG